MSTVMSQDEMDYYERRAEAELELAQRAKHPNVVKAHYHLAAYYLDRVHGDAGPLSSQRPSESELTAVRGK